MGSVAAGLASIGGSLAEAQELQRRDKIEQLKLAIEQGRLGVDQQYADANKQRLGIEKERLGIEKDRETRLTSESNKPTISKWQLMGNTMIAAGQNSDGSPFVKSIQLNPEIGYQLKALQDEIAQAPLEAQPILQSMTNGYIAEGNIKGAQDAIRPTLQAIAKDKALPQQDTVRTGYQALTIDIPGYGPAIVQVPTQSITKKLSRGESGSSLIPPMGPSTTTIPTPLASGATDHPEVPQSSAASSEASSQSGVPKIPLPPGSLIVGVKPLPGSKAQLKPEMQAGLRVLHVSLFGTPSIPGLKSTIGVLDSPLSRAKLIAAGVGSNPNPNQWTITKLANAGFYSAMSNEERNYVYQLNRSISAINALRSITGLPRSTQVLMDRYMMELPNPVTTPSSKDALNQLQLIEREIQAAVTDPQGGNTAIPVPPSVQNNSDIIPTDDVQKALDKVIGPVKK